MGETTIEWTDVTWNPVTGCDRVSPGCDHCYAMSLAPRLKAMGSRKYQRDGDPRTSGPGFGVTTHPELLAQPLAWRTPRRVFVNSMSVLFHSEIPGEFIAAVFATMAMTPQHTYQVLTKRHGRMRSLMSSTDFWRTVGYRCDDAGHPDLAPDSLNPSPNVWLGVSVEDQKRADLRIPALMQTPAAVRFLSMEPLLGPVDITRWLRQGEPRASLDWVIVGGESGPGARPVDGDWVRSLRDQCEASGEAFFFKQWGGRRPKANGRELDGRTWDEYPERAA